MRRNILLILLFGFGLGIFTSFGQTYLPEPFDQLANSYSVWLLFSFVCGMLLSRYRWALLAGALIQYMALATYYVLLHIRFPDAGFNTSSNIIWLVGGTLVGPVAGFCGRAYAYKSKYSTYALSFIIAVTLSEALFIFIQLRYVGEGLVFLALAAVLAILLLRDYSQRLQTIVPIIVLTSLAYVGFAYVLTAIFS